MQQYFIPAENMDNHTCILEKEDAYHVRNVMRSLPGDRMICSNGSGRTVIAQIREITKDKVLCSIEEEREEQSELPVHITIAQSLPKGDKFEWIIQKGTEMGASQFIPFFSVHTVVKYNQNKKAQKIDRWNKIIKEAAEQSYRNCLPKLEPMYSFQELLQIEADCKLVAYEKFAPEQTGSSPFAQALSTVDPDSQVVVVVGPEGGFAEEEITQLSECGFQPISLGPRILRTETASMYILAAISFYYEQMGGKGSW